MVYEPVLDCDSQWVVGMNSDRRDERRKELQNLPGYPECRIRWVSWPLATLYNILTLTREMLSSHSLIFPSVLSHSRAAPVPPLTCWTTRFLRLWQLIHQSSEPSELSCHTVRQGERVNYAD